MNVDTQRPPMLADSFASATKLDHRGDAGRHVSRPLIPTAPPYDVDDENGDGDEHQMAKLEIPSIVVHNNTCDSGGSCMERPRPSPLSKCRLSKQAEFEEADEECDMTVTGEPNHGDHITVVSGSGDDGDAVSSTSPPPPEVAAAAVTVVTNTVTEAEDEEQIASSTSSSQRNQDGGTAPAVTSSSCSSSSNSGIMAMTKKAASVDGGCTATASSQLTCQLKVRSESTSALPSRQSKDRTKESYFSHPKVKLLQRSHAVRGDDDACPPDLHLPAVSSSSDGGSGCGANLSVVTSQTAKSASSKHHRLGKQGSSGGSIDSNSSALSRDSSLEQYTDSTGVDLQQFIVDTLHKNHKDRLMLLKIEQELISLVKDAKRQHFRFPPMSAYQRMFVHRVAAFFGLDHNIDQIGTSVIVNKTKNTRIPDMKFRDQIRDELMPDEPKKSILKRDSSSLEDYKDVKSPERQLSSDGGCSDRRSKSFEEREEEYGKSSSSQEGAVDSPFSRSHDSTHNSSRRSSQEDLRWPGEPRPWSSTDSDSSSRPSNVIKQLVITKTSASTESEPLSSSSGGGHGGLALAKSDSSESDRQTVGASNKDSFLHPSTPSSRRAVSRVVPKASSFGGISVLVRADSAASTKSASPRLSKAESFSGSSGACSSVGFRDASGMEEEAEEQLQDDKLRSTLSESVSPVRVTATKPATVDMVTATTAIMPTAAPPPPQSVMTRPMTIATPMPPPPAIFQGFQGTPWIVPPQGQPVMWAVSNVESVPPGSILINPQTGQPFLNTDGTLYRHNLPPQSQPPSSSSSSSSSAASTTVQPMIHVNPYHQQTQATQMAAFGGTPPIQSQSPFMLCAAPSTTPHQQQDQRTFIMQEQASAADLMTSQLSGLSFAASSQMQQQQQQQQQQSCVMADVLTMSDSVLQQSHQHPSSSSAYSAIIPRLSQHQQQPSSLYYSLPTATIPQQQQQPIQSSSPQQQQQQSVRYVQQMTQYPSPHQQQQSNPTLTTIHPSLQGISTAFVDGHQSAQPQMQQQQQTPLPQTPQPQSFHQMQQCLQAYPAIFAYGQQQQQQAQQQQHVQLSSDPNCFYSASPQQVSSGSANFTFPAYAYTATMTGSGGGGLNHHHHHPPHHHHHHQQQQQSSILNNPSQQSNPMSFYPPQGQQQQQQHPHHHQQTVFRPQTPPANQSQGLAANANHGRSSYTLANHCSVVPPAAAAAQAGTFALYASQRLPSSQSQNIQTAAASSVPVTRTEWVPSQQQQHAHHQQHHHQQQQQQYAASQSHPPLPGTAFVATTLPVFRVPSGVHHQQMVRPNTPPPQPSARMASSSSSSNTAALQPVQPFVMPAHNLLNKTAAAAAVYGMPIVDQRFIKASGGDVTTYFVDASGGIIDGKSVMSANPLIAGNGIPRSSAAAAAAAQVYGRGLPTVVQGDFRLIGMPLQQHPHQMQATVRMPIMMQPQQHHHQQQQQQRSLSANRFHFSKQQSLPTTTTYYQGGTMAGRPPKLRRQRSKVLPAGVKPEASSLSAQTSVDFERGGNVVLEVEGVPDGLKRTETEHYLDEVISHGAKLKFVSRQASSSATADNGSGSESMPSLITAAAKQHIYAVFESETDAQNALIHIKTSKYQLRQPNNNTAAVAAAVTTVCNTSTSEVSDSGRS